MKLLKCARRVSWLFAVCTSAAAIAQDQQVNLPSLKDNTLYQDPMGTPSNGAGQHMFAGTSGSGLIRRAVIAFDIADNIPAGSTIQSVTLILNMSKTTSGAVDVDLLAATQDWGEGTSVASSGEGSGAPATPGDATWVHTFFDTQFWNAPGGDFVATPSATTTVNQPAAYSWSSPAMVTDVQGWLDQPATNFGWGLIATNFESQPMTAKRFDTKENSDPTVQPVLAITYTPPVSTGSVSLPALKDNTLYEDEGDMGTLSNGAGQHMFVGTTNFPGLLRRALIAFDIAGNIPAGSTIQSVTLTLNMSRTMGGAIAIDLRAATQDWGEGTSVASAGEGSGAPAMPGDATWVHTFFDTQFWNAQGGDFVGTSSATSMVDQPAAYSWSGPGMVTDVQGWLDQPSTNFGWGLIATNFEHLEMTAKRFDTRENSDPTLQPVLVVSFTAPQ
jgi:hypothetical protein